VIAGDALQGAGDAALGLDPVGLRPPAFARPQGEEQVERARHCRPAVRFDDRVEHHHVVADQPDRVGRAGEDIRLVGAIVQPLGDGAGRAAVLPPGISDRDRQARAGHHLGLNFDQAAVLMLPRPVGEQPNRVFADHDIERRHAPILARRGRCG
jgi:hypothetical protein